MSNGIGILNKPISLGESVLILVVTVGDCAFPRLEWLIKGYNENTWHTKDQYSNKEAMHREVGNKICLRYAEGQKKWMQVIQC